MPGPVRYTEKGKVKKSAPRKYESGKGWSKLSKAEQQSPEFDAPSRKSRIRQAATGPIGPQGGRKSQRRQSILAEISRQQDTRKTNQEALGFVGDALAKVASVVTEATTPKTDFDKAIEPLTMAIPSVGMLRGGSTILTGATRMRVPGAHPYLRTKRTKYEVDPDPASHRINFNTGKAGKTYRGTGAAETKKAAKTFGRDKARQLRDGRARKRRVVAARGARSQARTRKQMERESRMTQAEYDKYVGPE